MSGQLSVVSFNVRGLRDTKKRRAIFRHMHVNIVLCTSGIKDFVYQRAEGELINRIFNATSA